MYRLIDHIARRRLLYPAPTIAAPCILVLDIPVDSRGPGLALERYYPIVIENDEELVEAEEFLATPRSIPVRPDLLDRRRSCVEAVGIIITRYDPPQPGWPWLVTCRWPDDIASIARRNDVDMARDCYTIEMFEREAAVDVHLRALFDSLRQHRAVELTLISADRLPSAGSA